MVTQPEWTRGGLVFTRATLNAVEQDALRGYTKDEEACGYLTGPASEPRLCDTHVRLENIANKLHAMDPQVYFRTARMFFAFNEAKFDRAVREGEKNGHPVKVIYHSHLDAGAYFSATDAAIMSLGEPPEVEGGPWKVGPGPAWPLAFLVTSVRNGTIDEHKLFVWNSDQKKFVESPFSVIDVPPINLTPQS
ncbi:MAG: Mov34/MPN/PAD-1 family protein [Polyangiaceae bacterium]|nr:Mov34/MPN/PAD-1 family protein [Polyangiaceae bacterium]